MTRRGVRPPLVLASQRSGATDDWSARSSSTSRCRSKAVAGEPSALTCNTARGRPSSPMYTWPIRRCSTGARRPGCAAERAGGFQAAPLGQPVQWRPGRIEPAVEAVEPVQQASREFVLDPAAGDLPEPGPALAVANPDVVDEGVMHVAGKDQVVTRRARVAEDVHHHRGRAAMGHPVFRIDQQRLADPAEELLYALDQLDPEHRRRRHDDRRLSPSRSCWSSLSASQSISPEGRPRLRSLRQRRVRVSRTIRVGLPGSR